MHVDHSLLNQIIRAYYGKSNRTQIRQAAALSAEELLAPVPRTAAHSAVLMQRTPRFYLRENVVDAIRKLYARSCEDLNHNKRIQDVITKNPDLLRPPFMRTQFEFPWKPTVEGEPSTFLLTVTDEEEKRKKIPAVMEVMQKGVELMMRQEGLSLLQKMAGTAALLDTYVSSSIHMRMPNGQIVPGLFRNEVIVLLARNGLVRCHAPDYVPFGTKPPEWIMSMGFLTVITMLLLKSRTSILKIEKNQKQPPLGPQGQVRVMRDGKPEPRPFHVISFDLSREFHKNPGISPGDAERNVAEHLVMGHPKLRASGLWWWSPHWRGGTPEEKQARKGRVALGERTSDVFASRPQELVYPGDIGWVPAP